MTDEREAYRQKFESQLKQWNAEIEKLQAKAAEASADAKLEYERQIDDLRAKQQEAREKLDELQQAQGEAWKELKSGMDKAWDDMTQAMKRASEKLG